MKVIFLDVDGVLNNMYSKSRCQGYTGIDIDKVERLKEIVDATGAKIVLSSTWRLGYNKDGHRLKKHGDYLKRKFDKVGVVLYSVTPDLGKNGYYRGREIKQWIMDCGEEIERFVIIDDEMYDFNEQRLIENWLATSYYSTFGGLQPDHVQKAIDYLNNRAPLYSDDMFYR